MITSISNPQVKNLISLLKTRSAREEQGVFVAEGRKLTEELKGLSAKVCKTFYSATYFTQLYETLSSEEKEQCIGREGKEYEIVSDKIFTQMSDTVQPQGVMAIVSMPLYRMEDFLPKEQGTLLLLEDIRDPGNLGTMMRTAEAAGADGVILSKGCVDMFNPKVIRSTMGAIFRLPFVYTEDLCETIRQLSAKDIVTYAAHLSGENIYSGVSYAKKTAVLIGNEANGLKEETADCAKQRLKIPMEGKTESLNAAVAAALLLYEVYRYHRTNIK